MKLDKYLLNSVSTICDIWDSNSRFYHEQTFNNTTGLIQCKCDIAFNDDNVNIKLPIPFPLIEIDIVPVETSHLSNENIFDGDKIINIYRNEQLVAAFNNAFDDYANDLIKKLVIEYTEYYASGDFNDGIVRIDEYGHIIIK